MIVTTPATLVPLSMLGNAVALLLTNQLQAELRELPDGRLGVTVDVGDAILRRFELAEPQVRA